MTSLPQHVTTNEFADSRVNKVSGEFAAMRKFCIDSNMRGTFLFFGSARALSPAAHAAALEKAEAAAAKATTDEERAKAAMSLAKLKSQAWMPEYWEKTRDLAHRLTTWAKSAEGVKIGNSVPTNFPAANTEQPLIVCTGGGPGYMEAGSKGAFEANGASMGVGVVLPFETELNKYVSPGLGYTCDTFYTRKYWEVFCAKALIVCPGGVGTCDEMFEVLTLMQCQKMPKIPVVLLGKEFWTTAINLRFLADRGMMTHAEIDELCITDEPAAAVEFIVSALKKEAAEVAKAAAQ